MIYDLQSALAGNGFVGHYTNAAGMRVIASVYINSLDKDRSHKRASVLSQVSNLSNSAGGKRFYPLSGLTGIFMEPKEVILSTADNVEKIIVQALKNDRDVIFISEDSKTYARTCRSLGITRADHLINAELNALLSAGNSHEKYVAGNAHKLRDALIRLLNRAPQISSLGRIGKAIVPLIEEIINDIPSAVKFQLGDADMTLMDACSPDAPHLYKLPFENCLFEANLHYPDRKQKSFLLAKKVDENFYTAHFLYFDKDGKPGTGEIGLAWYTGDDQVKFGAFSYYEDPVSSDEHLQQISNAWLRAFMPYVAYLNDPKTEIINVSPLTKKRIAVGQQERSQFYDYLVLSPESKARLNELKGSSSEDVMPLHRRREHNRTFRNPRFVNMLGKTIRIREMTIGNEANGVVGKQYKLTF